MDINTFSHPCVTIDMLTDVWVEEVIKILVEVFVIDARSDVAIDTSSGVLDGAMIDVGSDIDADVLTDVNANVLVPVMTDLEFDMTAPPEE